MADKAAPDKGDPGVAGVKGGTKDYAGGKGDPGAAGVKGGLKGGAKGTPVPGANTAAAAAPKVNK